MAFHFPYFFLLNVHDKIKSICIWPSASKAYVYKKKNKYMECKVLIHGNVPFMQMYSRLMCKATVVCKVNSAVEEVEKRKL